MRVANRARKVRARERPAKRFVASSRSLAAAKGSLVMRAMTFLFDFPWRIFAIDENERTRDNPLPIDRDTDRSREFALMISVRCSPILIRLRSLTSTKIGFRRCRGGADGTLRDIRPLCISDSPM
jgi:hypothetical protein